ncbi:MAG: outer membrane lipid asymmetry maintenance protein MlaD [Betaproteobacteria bacterium TMED41]|nr:MAG: outer membrane lipid asymmetry maintenance protein MlaD [Betaproteobacteria bacterium TMED41]|tara:strand:+ start:993 stop:1487 length:495 start_codon:yes stop_codon:yes gene_type:complete
MNKINFSVGIFFLLGMASLMFLSLNVSNLVGSSIDSEYELLAYFDDIGGLKPKAAVRSSGVLVGRVKDIEFDSKRYQAKVVIEMQRGVRFPLDSSATILTAGLLGEKYIGITPGAEIDFLKKDDKIQMTQSAVILENIISQFLFNQSSNDDASGKVSGSGEIFK